MAVWDDAVFLWNPLHGFPSLDQVTGKQSDSALPEGSELTTATHPGRLYNGAVGSRFVAPIPDLKTTSWSIFGVGRLAGDTRTARLGIFRGTDSDQWTTIIVASSAGVSDADFRLNGAATPGGVDWPLVAFSDFTGDTDLHVFVARYTRTDDSNGVLAAYEDSSTAIGSDTLASASVADTTQVTVGRYDDSTPSDSVNGEWYAAAAWSRAITTGEIDEILADPYAYLETPTHVLVRSHAAPPSAVATTTFTLTIPADVEVGDDLCVVACSRDHTGVTDLPTLTDDDAGGNLWTLKGNTADRKALLWWKKATAATAGKTVTFAGGVGSSTGGLTALSNGAAGDPTVNITFESNATGDESAAGIIPTAADSMVVASIINYTNDHDISAYTFATLGSLMDTWWQNESTGGSDCQVALSGRPTFDLTATGNLTWTQIDAATYSLIFEVLAAQPPAVPANLTATTQSATSILVEWDNVADETGYRVERSPNGTTGWVDVSGSLAADTISFLNSGLVCGTLYFYRVFAFNAVGDSAPSNVDSDTTTACSSGGEAVLRSPRTRLNGR